MLWRAPTGLALPVVKVLPDGTFLSVLINPAIQGARRRAAILAAAREIAEVDTDGAAESERLDPDEAHLVRVVEYDVPDRAGNGSGELIVLLITICDPADARADELAAAYHERWEEETGNDQLKTHLRGPGKILRSRLPELVVQEIMGLAVGPSRAQRLDHPGRRGRGPRPRPSLIHPGPAHRPPHRHRDGGLSP